MNFLPIVAGLLCLLVQQSTAQYAAATTTYGCTNPVYIYKGFTIADYCSRMYGSGTTLYNQCQCALVQVYPNYCALPVGGYICAPPTQNLQYASTCNFAQFPCYNPGVTYTPGSYVAPSNYNNYAQQYYGNYYGAPTGNVAAPGGYTYTYGTAAPQTYNTGYGTGTYYAPASSYYYGSSSSNCPAGSTAYYVQPGDSFWNICYARSGNNVDVANTCSRNSAFGLYNYNPTTNAPADPAYIQANTYICIPSCCYSNYGYGK